ncbi:MAG: hypothetical protein IJX04_08920 [Oscillospiraceae bacterium]|nr:hypothetical protein [Oscillospiraceae bacterium]
MMNEWILSSSVLIAAVLLGRFLLRGKISLRLQYALWAVVLVRLLLPVQLFTSDFGTGSVAQTVDIAEPVRQVYFSANENRYEQEYDIAFQKVVAEYEAANRPADPIVIEKTAQAMAETRLEVDFKSILLHIWFAGMVVMTAVIISCNVHLALQLKRRRWALDIPESLLSVYVTEAVPTPCVFGFFRPAVYLTPEAAKEPQVRRHVLEHELTHYRHFDHVWSVLRSLCLVLHWYNPLVWIAAKVSRADAELACDEGALARLGEDQRGDYGRTLIGLTCSAPISDLLITATTMTGSAGSIRERIKLLMKRPRNTILTVTAVILMVTLIVGCTFAGAPELPTETTTPPETIAPVETTAPSDTTPPGVDNDMSYTGQELPIPEDPAAAGLLNADGLLTYPSFDWFLTEEEVLSKLGLAPADCLEYEKTSGDGMWANSFTVRSTDAFGVPMKLCFTFRSYWENVEPVLTEVYGTFMDHADFDAVRSLYAQALGDTDVQITPGLEERWDSDILLLDLVGKDGYEVLDRCAKSALNVPASYVQWLNNGTPEIIWFTELPEPDDRISEVTGLFSQYADPAYRAALLQLYDYADPEPEPFTLEELFLPEIVEVTLTTKDDAVVFYRRPGGSRLYAVQLYYAEEEGCWFVLRNRMVLQMEDYPEPRTLTETELQQFRSAFRSILPDGGGNPAACFLLPYYEDISQMDGGEFLAYFPTDQEGTKEEFELLKAKYPDFFADWTWETMPIPIHCYSAKEIDAVVSRYGNIHWVELSQGVHYLEETGCYYNYTSDFGLGGFSPRGGFVYDGGAVVYSDFSTLFFTETAGSYTISAHMPAIVMVPPSSHTMIPAENSPETAVKAVAETFLTAYEENVYLYTDNEYDHLTVLSADSDATVSYNGRSVPLSDFHENIYAVHDREAHRKQSRQEQGIYRHNFETACHFQSITFDGDTATVMAEYAMSFTYDDRPGTTSGGRDEFKLLLVQVDGSWLVAEVTELGA